MNRLVTAGLLGAIAIALGAFGAHGFKDRLALIPEAAGWWQTATFYLLTHAVAIGAIAGRSIWPASLWAIGSVIFAGTLYAMALGAPRWFGAITPIGGSLLIAGWLLLAWSGRKES
ncbi:MAG: hypothetical protein RLZZ23_1639 [Verrucomicrobiota bacterium]|jgi:uncharacterized membrane protein YgdD (TMEM256/DUF423 family)